ASAASLPPRLPRLLPAGATVAGRDSHPLKDRAFARRTHKQRKRSLRKLKTNPFMNNEVQSGIRI
ncbi:MAG: hypothetical protein ACYCQM_13195, partial [Acidithiobacillus sp.]